MPSIDFPNSPTVGQTFTQGYQTWVWDGISWILVASPGPVGATGPAGATGATGPVGATGPSGGGPFAGASKAVITNTSDFFIYKFGDPNINPSQFKFSQVTGLYRAGLFSVTDPDGIFSSDIPNGEGAILAAAGTYTVICNSFVGPTYFTPASSFQYMSLGYFDMVSENFIERKWTPFYSVYAADQNLSMSFTVTQSLINDETHIDPSLFYIPADNQYVAITKFETTVYFWPEA